MSDDTPGDVQQREGAEQEPLDRLFSVLSDSHRRRVLAALNEADSLPVDELVPAGDTAEETAQVRVELVHIHLPLLKAVGYVEWDKTTETVSQGPLFEEITHCLDLLESHADSLPGRWP